MFPRLRCRARRGADPSPVAARGFTLLELLAVVVLLGIVAASTIASYRRDTLGNLGARAAATRLSTALLLARREAISTGDNHLVAFERAAGAIVGFRVLRRRPDGALEEVQGLYALEPGVAATAAVEPEFTFEGEAVAPATIELAGESHRWQVVVQTVTGFVSVTRVA